MQRACLRTGGAASVKRFEKPEVVRCTRGESHHMTLSAHHAGSGMRCGRNDSPRPGAPQIAAAQAVVITTTRVVENTALERDNGRRRPRKFRTNAPRLLPLKRRHQLQAESMTYSAHLPL
jgi:hypothetical protein